LSINWITGRTFESAAKDKGTELLKELLRDSSRSPLYATVVIITIVALWEGFNRVVFLKASYNEWSYYTDFPSDIKASLGEMSLGLLAAAAVATLLLSVIKVFPRRLRLVPDVVFQAMQVAPLAFVSYTPLNVIRAQLLMGTDDIFKGFAWVTWTAADVAVFSFYPFALTFHGLGGEPMARRIALSLDAALPYAGAAVIYGETMFAVSGLGFSMIVAAVSFKLFSALAAFATLLFLIAILSTCLRWIAKRGLAPTPQQEMIAPSSAAA
jgi:ABC-type nitrate/sulfonate/bicarbonate transport system permease component